jgi:enamine deaminase RidA (YjgF/YER057c/UK114 family)
MTDDLAAGLPYDYAAVAAAGSIVFTAGACPLDRDGAIVAPGDHRAQAEQTVDNLLAILARHGAGPTDLVRTTVYVVGTRDEMRTAWYTIAERLAPHRPPSTLLGVTSLGYSDQLVEIDGIAAIASDRR